MCVKCVIDSGKAAAAGIHLAESAKAWAQTSDALHDSRLSPVALTDAERAQIVETSQTWCDLADHINEVISKSNEIMCSIAVAHSGPKKE